MVSTTYGPTHLNAIEMWADVVCWTMSYVWISLQTCWQQQALQRNSKHIWIQKHLWLAFCADLLTTASTEWTFQTYISTNTWWAMWGCPCSLIDNIMHCNVVSNIHNYKEPMSYVRHSLQTFWQQQTLQRNIKHTYLQKHLISYEVCVDVYACEPQYHVQCKSTTSQSLCT